VRIARAARIRVSPPRSSPAQLPRSAPPLLSSRKGACGSAAAGARSAVHRPGPTGSGWSGPPPRRAPGTALRCSRRECAVGAPEVRCARMPPLDPSPPCAPPASGAADGFLSSLPILRNFVPNTAVLQVSSGELRADRPHTPTYLAELSVGRAWRSRPVVATEAWPSVCWTSPGRASHRPRNAVRQGGAPAAANAAGPY
jgi:hypothetical protein